MTLCLTLCVYSVIPDGTVIGIQFDSRSKLLNLLHLDEGQICQEEPHLDRDIQFLCSSTNVNK